MPHHAHHDHPTLTPSAPFAWGIGLNLAFVALEALAGLHAHSVALLSDAAHNLSDVLGLSLAWVAIWLARSAPTARRTYGLRRSTILTAVANALLLLVTVGAVAWEAIGRLRDPPQVQGWLVVGAALAGVAVNGVSAWLFRRGRDDLNVRAAFQHLVADALVSVGVAASGALLLLGGWRWLDPLASLGVSAVILVSTFGLLRQSLDLALDAVPDTVDPARIRNWLAKQPGVCAVHDLHIWAMSTTETALTVHLAMTTRGDHADLVQALSETLHRDFAIGHPTIQIEAADPVSACRLEPEAHV